MTVTDEPPVTTINKGMNIFDGPLGNITIVALTAYGIVVVLLLVIATLLVALGCTCKKHKSLRRLTKQQYTLEHEVPSMCTEDKEERYTSMENPMKDEPEFEQTSQTEENCHYSPVEHESELNIQTEENCRYSRVEPEFELAIQTEENCCYGTGREESHLYEVEYECDEDDYVISSISVSRD